MTAVPGTPAGFPELNSNDRLPALGFRLSASGFRPSQSGSRKPRAGSLNSFRRPQFRAAGSRVATLLLLGCGYRLLGQHPEVLVLISTLAKGILYDAIFQRVKTDHHHASSWLQNPRRRFQQRLQIVQFAVYEDSKSLKSERRRMNPPLVMSVLTPIHWPGRG